MKIYQRWQLVAGNGGWKLGFKMRKMKIFNKRAMEEEDTFIVDNIEGGLCVNYTDAGIGGRFYSGSNQDKGKAMAEEDAFLVDNVEGGLCVDYTDAGIGGRCNSGSDKDKG
ncbi:hypothetical protein Tco_1239101 [Tanacetum coccineum]